MNITGTQVAMRAAARDVEPLAVMADQIAALREDVLADVSAAWKIAAPRSRGAFVFPDRQAYDGWHALLSSALHKETVAASGEAMLAAHANPATAFARGDVRTAVDAGESVRAAVHHQTVSAHRPYGSRDSFDQLDLVQFLQQKVAAVPDARRFGRLRIDEFQNRTLISSLLPRFAARAAEARALATRMANAHGAKVPEALGERYRDRAVAMLVGGEARALTPGAAGPADAAERAYFEPVVDHAWTAAATGSTRGVGSRTELLTMARSLASGSSRNRAEELETTRTLAGMVGMLGDEAVHVRAMLVEREARLLDELTHVQQLTRWDRQPIPNAQQVPELAGGDRRAGDGDVVRAIDRLLAMSEPDVRFDLTLLPMTPEQEFRARIGSAIPELG